MNGDFSILPPRAAERLLGLAGGRGGHVEHAHNRRRLRAAIAALASEDVIGGNAALAVGRPGQRHLHRRAEGPAAHLDGIAHGVDVLVDRLHMFIHANTAARADLQPGRDRQAVLGPHADAHQHEPGREAFACFEPHGEALGSRFDRLGRLAQEQPHVVARRASAMGAVISRSSGGRT